MIPWQRLKNWWYYPKLIKWIIFHPSFFFGEARVWVLNDNNASHNVTASPGVIIPGIYNRIGLEMAIIGGFGWMNDQAAWLCWLIYLVRCSLPDRYLSWSDLFFFLFTLHSSLSSSLLFQCCVASAASHNTIFSDWRSCLSVVCGVILLLIHMSKSWQPRIC